MSKPNVVTVTFGLLAVFLPLGAGAQERASSSNSELLLADEQTVVTASKAVQKTSDAPAAVTVITEEQIRESGATTLLDILRYAVGVDVFEQNGSAGNVSIRGFNSQYSNKLLVMIDGRSIYRDFYGGVYWYANAVLISRIKRVEIVRGPGSALYGANAFNGVINIITKTPAELASAPEKVTTRLLTGERNTQLDEGQITIGNAKDVSASIGLAYNHSNGFGGQGTRALHDSYTSPIATFDVEKRLPQGSLRFAAGTVNAVTDVSETISILAHTHMSFLSLVYAEDRAKNPVLIRLYGNLYKEDGSGVRYDETQMADAEIQQSRRLSAQHNLIYGGSFRYITEHSDLTGPRNHNQTLFAFYGQDQWQLAPVTQLFVGLRLDNHSLYGTNVSPRLSLVHHLPAAQTLRASFGTSFRAPTLEDTYVDQSLPTGPSTTLHILGNAHLKPEQVLSYEVGYRKETAQGHWGANLYYNRVTHLIGFRPVNLNSPTAADDVMSANLGNATAFGLELEAQGRLSRRLRAQANYAYQDIHDKISDLGSYVMPKHKINLSADWNFAPRWDAFLGAHFVGAADVFNGHQATVNAYTRVDARLGYQFGTKARPWSLSAIATNLFDDHHYEYPNFGSTTGTLEVARHTRTLYLALQGGF